MLASRTTKANGQVAFPFANIVRQKIRQQIGDAVNELSRLRKRTDVLGHLRMLAGVRTQTRNKVGIRQKAHVEHQVGVLRHALLRSEEHTSELQSHSFI